MHGDKITMRPLTTAQEVSSVSHYSTLVERLRSSLDGIRLTKWVASTEIFFDSVLSRLSRRVTSYGTPSGFTVIGLTSIRHR
jgi:hypothetical protein